MKNDIFFPNISDFFGVTGQIGEIEIIPCKIKYLFAGITDKMMMGIKRYLISCLIFQGLHSFYQAMTFKGGKGSVYSIQRYGGHAIK